MRKIKIAINGCGRIGRAFLKLAAERAEIEIAAVNDLAAIENIAYLLKYDTVYGRARIHADKEARIGAEKGNDGKQFLIFGNHKIIYLNEKDATKLPWKDLEIDLVVEATGLFTSYEKAKVHLEAGAKKVVITAPMKDSISENLPLEKGALPSEAGGISDLEKSPGESERATPFMKGGIGGEGNTLTTPSVRTDTPPWKGGEEEEKKGATILMGINEEKFAGCEITSNASCTTNAGSPLIAILDEAIGIEKAVLNTVHGYTASQGIVDGPNKKDFREGRAAAQNIVPSSTGAAIAVTKAFPKLAGLFDGVSMRVPVVCGSIVDITFIAKRATTKEEVNEILKKASGEKRWKGIFATTEEDLVSSDIIGDPHASIADLKFTRVVGGNLVKVMAWYDNEFGYTNTLIKHVIEAGSN